MPIFGAFFRGKPVTLTHRIVETQMFKPPKGEARPYLPTAVTINAANELVFETRGPKSRDVLNTNLSKLAQYSTDEGGKPLNIGISERGNNELVITINSGQGAMTPTQAIEAFKTQKLINPETARQAQRDLAQLPAPQPVPPTESTALLAPGS
jgi:hypothetical protein